MGREDIDRMITESLESPQDRRPIPGRRPLPHGDRILDQYAALCREGEGGQAEPSAEVALPVAPAEPRPQPAPANPVASMLRRALSRVKR